MTLKVNFLIVFYGWEVNQARGALTRNHHRDFANWFFSVRLTHTETDSNTYSNWLQGLNGVLWKCDKTLGIHFFFR